MTIEEMNATRIELGLTYNEIAKQADMPLSTVQKILGGLTKAPRKDSLLRIQQVLLREHQAQPFSSAQNVTYSTPVSSTACLAEAYFAYGSTAAKDKKQGEYTLDDYYSLPEDYRAELIDGVLYDMGAPTSPHQLIGGSIHAQLLNFRNKRKGTCLPFIAPVDVQLDCDDKTMVQPDVLIVCDRSKVVRRCVYGAPDFIVEVLSPSTRKKDMSKKMQKYIDAGVREYWLVDPDKRQIIVYDTEHLEFPVLYTFRDQVPVLIWGGECLIDFTDVNEILDDLFPEGKVVTE